MKLARNICPPGRAVGRVSPLRAALPVVPIGAHGVTRPTVRRESAFTMVEIAISLAIIGFALAAILGVLPIGMSAQKDNQQETIINQDAAYWIEAIRTGARAPDDLTNNVDVITNFVMGWNPDGSVAPGFPVTVSYTRTNWIVNNAIQPPFYELTSGSNIIGLLSTPKYEYWNPANQILKRSNFVVAYVRALSGAASEKFPQDNPNVRDLAFKYRMVAEIVPYAGWDTNWVQTNAPGLSPQEFLARSNYLSVVQNLSPNLRDVRLLFRWPTLPNGDTGNGRQTYRTTVSGTLTNEPAGSPWWFFQPQTFVNALATP